MDAMAKRVEVFLEGAGKPPFLDISSKTLMEEKCLLFEMWPGKSSSVASQKSPA